MEPVPSVFLNVLKRRKHEYLDYMPYTLIIAPFIFGVLLFRRNLAGAWTDPLVIL